MHQNILVHRIYLLHCNYNYNDILYSMYLNILNMTFLLNRLNYTDHQVTLSRITCFWNHLKYIIDNHTNWLTFHNPIYFALYGLTMARQKPWMVKTPRPFSNHPNGSFTCQDTVILIFWSSSAHLHTHLPS